MKKQNIVIATPLLFPQVGGSAFYADVFSRHWTAEKHIVTVVGFGSLLKFPTGIRHFLYMCKLARAILHADVVYALDTFSVALPSVILCHFLRKKIIIRVAGDFLWESYVNRTREQVLLSEFYTEERRLTFKESTIFDLTDFIFRYATHIVFSTEWQRKITIDAYSINVSKTHVVENVYASRTKRNIVPKNRIILSPLRNVFLKNKKGLEDAFTLITDRFFDPVLDTEISTYERLLERIQEAYMVVVPSISEVSPNLVLDALSLGVPVVVTKDCGIKERLGDLVVWVDPKDPRSIAEGMQLLMDARTYSEYMARISKFSYVQTEEMCARQFLNIGQTQ